jgi:hypothetical protein
MSAAMLPWPCVLSRVLLCERGFIMVRMEGLKRDLLCKRGWLFCESDREMEGRGTKDKASWQWMRPPKPQTRKTRQVGNEGGDVEG